MRNHPGLRTASISSQGKKAPVAITTNHGAHQRPARRANPSTAESAASANAPAAAIFTCPVVPVSTMAVAACSARLGAGQEERQQEEAHHELDGGLEQRVVDDRLEPDGALQRGPQEEVGASVWTRSRSLFMSNGFSSERTPRESAISRPALDPVVSTTGTSARLPPSARSDRTSQPPSASGIMKSTSTSAGRCSRAISTARRASPQESTE